MAAAVAAAAAAAVVAVVAVVLAVVAVVLAVVVVVVFARTRVASFSHPRRREIFERNLIVRRRPAGLERRRRRQRRQNPRWRPWRRWKRRRRRRWKRKRRRRRRWKLPDSKPARDSKPRLRSTPAPLQKVKNVMDVKYE